MSSICLDKTKKIYFLKKKNPTKNDTIPPLWSRSSNPILLSQDRPFISIPLNKFWVGMLIPIGEKGVNKKRQQRIASTPNHTRPHIDNLIPLDIPIRKLIIPKKKTKILKKNPLRVCLVGVKSG